MPIDEVDIPSPQGDFMQQVRMIVTAVAVLYALDGGHRAAAAVDPAVMQAEERRVALVEKVSAAVVSIFGSDSAGGGSGVLIGPDGFALTNFHVISGSIPFMKCGLNDGELYDAVIVGMDPTGDVALIKLLGRDDFPHASLGDSDTVRVGDSVYVMGNPFLLASDFQPTVTYGMVSGVHRYQYPAGTFLEYTDCIQTDASINPGNSGGPMFDEQGQLIGINGRASFGKRGRVNVGAGYAISINQIRNFMGHLQSGRIVDHASLGATVATETGGEIVIADLLDESEAYRRGLRVGDELVSFAGRRIRSVNQFKNILGIYPKGWMLPMVVRRDGHKHEMYLRLRGLHRQSEMTAGQRKVRLPPMRPQPDQPRPGKDNPEDKKPLPHPLARLLDKTPKPPEQHKHLYEEKEGFANYYFNGVERDRTLKGLAGLGDFSDVSGRWTLSGRTTANVAFELVLSDQGVGLELGSGRVYVQEVDRALADEPPGTGGLLVALHHLRLLLTQQDEPFSEFYYLGSEPLDGRGPTVDVIVSLLTGIECRWYFRTTDGGFAGFDTRLSEDSDPCEIRFGRFAEFDGRQLPAHIEVRSGENEFATFLMDQVQLSSGAGEKSAQGKKRTGRQDRQLAISAQRLVRTRPTKTESLPSTR
jgi:S1-C subfamily serine protease